MKKTKPVKGKKPQPPVGEQLEDGGKNWRVDCQVCGASPTVHPTDLCGPCCFGTADAINGGW